MIPPNWEFLWANIFHACTGWTSCKHSLVYHVHLIPEDILLQEVNAFAHWTDLSIEQDCREEDSEEGEDLVALQYSSATENDNMHKFCATVISNDDLLKIFVRSKSR